MQTSDFHFINSQDFFADSIALAEQVKKFGTKFDYLIAINRGGAVLGRYLSDLLTVPMGAFAMASYVGVNLRKELKITQELNLDLKDKNILIVDEICDSGTTFIKALDYVNLFSPAQIQTAALVVKPHASYKPDFWVQEIDKWVVFPYEMIETFKATKDQSEEVKTMIKDFFVKGGAELSVVESLYQKALP